MSTQLIGHRMTSQRKLILDIIRTAKGHLDADEIYRLAREKDHHISLSTVYRNLNLLKESELVAERHLGEDHHFYELNVHPQHHHLVCIGCGEVFEFECEFTEKMKSELEEASQFQITSIEVELRGYCPECQRKKG